MPWDRADAQIDLLEDLALVRVSAEALGVPLDDVDAAICAASGNWRTAMQVGLPAAPLRHLPTRRSAHLGEGALLQRAARLEGVTRSQGCAGFDPLYAPSVQSMTAAGAGKQP